MMDDLESLRHKNALFMDLNDEVDRYFKLFKEKA